MKRAHARQNGLTLVELMIAIVLGALVTLGLTATYVSANRSYIENERYALMQENGRFALKLLSEDLAMADFWGQVLSTDTISTALAVPVGNCGESMQLLSADSALLFNNYHVAPAATQFTPCNAIASVLEAGTDLLVIKRVEGATTARTFVDVADTDGDGDTSENITEGAGNLRDDVVYLRTNGTTGELIDDATGGNPPALGESDWRYMPRVYFVRSYYDTPGDGTPALCRMDIQDPGRGLGGTQCLAEGIEDLHFQFGVDDDDDGTANRYLSSPTLAEMETAVTARIYVLVRSADAAPHYTNAKSYTLGDVNVAATNDGFYRRVYHTTVVLRNPLNRSLIN